MSENRDLVIEKEIIKPGEYKKLSINVGRLPSDTKINIRAHIYRGKKPGPTVLILGGIHGDEIVGIEVVRRFMGLSILVARYQMVKMSIEVFLDQLQVHLHQEWPVPFLRKFCHLLIMPWSFIQEVHHATTIHK